MQKWWRGFREQTEAERAAKWKALEELVAREEEQVRCSVAVTLPHDAGSVGSNVTAPPQAAREAAREKRRVAGQVSDIGGAVMAMFFLPRKTHAQRVVESKRRRKNMMQRGAAHRIQVTVPALNTLCCL